MLNAEHVLSTEINWEPNAGGIRMRAQRVYDPDRDSFYIYDVFLSPDDLRKTIDFLAKQTIIDDKVAQIFSAHLDRLLKILLSSAGIATIGGKSK